MRMFQRAAFGAALFLSGSALATGAFAADNIAADLDQPLWYQAPSEKTLELAKIDDLSSTVVSDGQRGEKGVLGSSIQLTPEQIEKVKAGQFKVAISLGWLGDDWASEQLNGLKETFASLGIEVVAETNANWDDAKQISDLDSIAVLKPDLLVSIPLNGQTTAAAYKRIAEAGTKVVFIDQAVDGMDPGKDYVSIVSSDNLALGMYIADELARAIGGKGDVAAMYFANDFYVTNLRYEGFVARLMAKYPDVKLVAAAGHDDPNKGQEVAQALLARYPNLNGLYGSWSIPAMGAATAAQIAGLSPETFKIVCENFDQIVAANMAGKGFIAGISSQRPYDQGAAEAKVGALALIGESTPPYVVVPPLAVNRENLPASYKTIYRHDLPAEMSAALSN
ncbi:substrate-binding domain-containing protein [Aureimonas phyllosphaerae]|uniref:Ribose transport system substrate-binding protein n=1 Tax=Aureimonas phyllosphaerae TaxID=1166078 RepID=A0A7W6BUF6_9HYPH|nr:substrate-binding domain-containing protein [Aureimonas phyllosphaerae]MBB3938228.1 ribose transport system substrate-binding protein [Aureimonas phyllosphaerae]MBB3962226.1 ribose transport system substrate-binding protein [Aureimonas phyllosphaerae]SFF58306.1 ribose transport system substrate-binding protein [Aureimonas phyllosphaerae]